MIVRNTLLMDRGSVVLKEQELVEMAKALGDHLGQQLDGRVKELESSLTMVLGKVLGEHLHKRLEGELQQHLEDVVTKRLEGEFTKRLEAMEADYQGRLQALEKSLQQSHEEKLSLIQQAQEMALEKFRDMMQALPPPTVNVAVPEMNPRVVVHVPKQQAPVVNVPEQPAPVVNVTLPEPRPVKKSIEYDGFGRPTTITES